MAVDELPIARCKRLVRPLVSKIHGLTDLHAKYPFKFAFQTDSFPTKDVRAFIEPASSAERLRNLRPFLASEVYDAYLEIFQIFRNIVLTLAASRAKRAKRIEPLGPPRLAFLAAQKLGKSVALGSKSTYYSLSQTSLFDPLSIPQYLRKYHDEMADDIDTWLTMDPEPVFRARRAELVWGYVVHILMLNLANLLYTLVPVLAHWLHEEDPWRLRLFLLAFWLTLAHDPDLKDSRELLALATDNLPTFWLFHATGYWNSLVKLVGICSPNHCAARPDPYECLLIDVLGEKVDIGLISPDEVYALLHRNVQHPENTTVLMSMITQCIASFTETQLRLKNSKKACLHLHETYQFLLDFVRNWLALSDKCIYNSQDRGNNHLFKALNGLNDYLLEYSLTLLLYLAQHQLRTQVRSTYEKVRFLHSQLEAFALSCQILCAFFQDTALTASISQPILAGEYFADLYSGHHSEAMLSTFATWLWEQTLPSVDKFCDTFLDHVHGAKAKPW